MVKLPEYNKKEHMSTGIIEFDDEKCTRCGTCAPLCPSRSIIIPPKNVNRDNRELPYNEEVFPGITLCMACGDCLAACPNNAITIKRGLRVTEPFLYHRITQSQKFTYPKKY